MYLVPAVWRPLVSGNLQTLSRCIQTLIGRIILDFEYSGGRGMVMLVRLVVLGTRFPQLALNGDRVLSHATDASTSISARLDLSDISAHTDRNGWPG